MMNFNNNASLKNHMSDSNKSFNIMFRIVVTFIALVMTAMIVMMILIFSGNAPYSYHYEVNYGNNGYSQTETLSNNN